MPAGGYRSISLTPEAVEAARRIAVHCTFLSGRRVPLSEAIQLVEAALTATIEAGLTPEVWQSTHPGPGLVSIGRDSVDA